MPKIPHSSVHRMHGIAGNLPFCNETGIVRYELMYIIEPTILQKSAPISDQSRPADTCCNALG